MFSGDTIIAISSAVGVGVRMIVRASGPAATQLASDLWQGASPEASHVASGTIAFANLEVSGCWVYVFRSPRSYTGEDLVEFHVPANALLARMLLDDLVARGARPADPGEFTARAYFNGRLDLTEAEGVAATIAASGEQELRAARQLLAGELARRLRPATNLVAETLALAEAGIDFADEGVSFLSATEVTDRIDRVDALLRDLLDNSSRFGRLAHEPRVVLVGRPNAGKSTLLNALAGHERAVTSPVAGTTRDVLTADVALPRGIVKLTDAAGLGGDDAHNDATPADVARQMRENALRAAETADVLVLVRDVTDSRPDLQPLPRAPDLIIKTKADLLKTDTDGFAVSAKSGANLDALRRELDRLAFGARAGAGAAGATALALNARHVQAVSEARDALARAGGHVAGDGAELVALELREALDAVGRVVGVVTPDDVLGRIFSTFCIGK
jgi:tRNA modification GTPase